MDWREWFGFSKPRDAPKTELPQIEDNVRDSGGIFVFGQTLSGERVDEKSALQIATVYACVRLLAKSFNLPLSISQDKYLTCVSTIALHQIRKWPLSHRMMR